MAGVSLIVIATQNVVTKRKMDAYYFQEIQHMRLVFSQLKL